MSSERKIVRVQYSHQDVFKLPKGLDLENKTQVKFWGVKYNTLYITKVDGTELNIDSEGWVQDHDYKHPDIAEIIDADDEGIEFSDEEEEDDCVYIIKTYKFNHIEQTIDYAGLWEDENGNKEFKTEEEARQEFEYARNVTRGFASVELIKIDPNSEDRETCIESLEDNIMSDSSDEEDKN
jgi:hypothetical protein